MERIFVTSDGRIILQRPFKKDLKIADLVQNVIIVRRDPDRQILRRSDAYGFNKLMIDTIACKAISVCLTTGGFLKTTPGYLKEKAFVQQFEGQEEQYFLKIRFFGLEKAQDWERSQRCQDYNPIREAMQRRKEKIS